MTKSGDAPVELLLKSLRSDSRHARAVAAVELGRRGAREALPELEVLLDDPDDLVAVAAMFANWLLGAEDVPLDRAAASLASDDEEEVQAAVHALCEMGESALPRLVGLLQARSPHAPQILRVLGDIGGHRARASVERAAESSDPDIAERARIVLDEWEED